MRLCMGHTYMDTDVQMNAKLRKDQTRLKGHCASAIIRIATPYTVIFTSECGVKLIDAGGSVLKVRTQRTIRAL